ncbi:hypothetical protein Cgig2_013874 [Carnegiea gigantea]|uniref:Uncharacterized protein n=1 Tax=Carnegiea gigantea TaxID=171969 RepID=A0A9Q1KKF8_9CARY|nr:hypothetical protein Cgig2_013874 [Carnegiea gigantea]
MEWDEPYLRDGRLFGGNSEWALPSVVGSLPVSAVARSDGTGEPCLRDGRLSGCNGGRAVPYRGRLTTDLDSDEQRTHPLYLRDVRLLGSNSGQVVPYCSWLIAGLGYDEMNRILGIGSSPVATLGGLSATVVGSLPVSVVTRTILILSSPSYCKDMLTMTYGGT